MSDRHGIKIAKLHRDKEYKATHFTKPKQFDAFNRGEIIQLKKSGCAACGPETWRCVWQKYPKWDESTILGYECLKIKGLNIGQFIYLFVEEYHAACGPCGTISLRIARFSYRSLRRVDRVRKANRASQLNNGDSVRTRERRREGEWDCMEGKERSAGWSVFRTVD